MKFPHIYLIRKVFRYFLKLLKVPVSIQSHSQTVEHAPLVDNNVEEKSGQCSDNPNVLQLQKLAQCFSPSIEQEQFLSVQAESNRNIHAIAEESPAVCEILRQFDLERQRIATSKGDNPEKKSNT